MAELITKYTIIELGPYMYRIESIITSSESIGTLFMSNTYSPAIEIATIPAFTSWMRDHRVVRSEALHVRNEVSSCMEHVLVPYSQDEDMCIRVSSTLTRPTPLPQKRKDQISSHLRSVSDRRWTCAIWIRPPWTTSFWQGNGQDIF